MRGLPWSCSAHAKDIWTTPDWEKREKLAECRLAGHLHRCGAAHLAALAPPGRAGQGRAWSTTGSTWRAFRRRPPPAAGGARRARPTTRCVLLSVGRAVAKKGYDDLLEALAALPAGPRLALVHIGGAAAGRETASAGGARSASATRIDWLGTAQPQRRGARGLPRGRPLRAGQPGRGATATATACPTC